MGTLAHGLSVAKGRPGTHVPQVLQVIVTLPAPPDPLAEALAARLLTSSSV